MFVLKNRNTAVNALAFSPDGDALAASGYWGYLQVWDLASRSLRFERRAGTTNQAVNFFAGSSVYTFDYELHAYDAKTGDPARHPHRRVNEAGILAPAPWPVPCFCVARGGRRSIACQSLADAQRLWMRSLPVADEYRFLRGRGNLFPQALVTAMAFAGNGKTVAVGCASGEVYVLHAADGKSVAEAHDTGLAGANAVALSPDGSRLVVAAGAHLRVYTVGDELTEVRRSSYGRKHVLGVTWHPSGEFFATAGGDGAVTFWDAETGERIKSFEWGYDKINDVTFNADGDLAACASSHGEVVVWDVDR